MIIGENIFRNWIFGSVLLGYHIQGDVGTRVTGKTLLLVAHYTPSCGVPAWVRKGSGCDLERNCIEHKGPLRLSHFSDMILFKNIVSPSSYDLPLHRALSRPHSLGPAQGVGAASDSTAPSSAGRGWGGGAHVESSQKICWVGNSCSGGKNTPAVICLLRGNKKPDGWMKDEDKSRDSGMCDLGWGSGSSSIQRE